ncbi:MAG: trigger factor [Patescibacteria group bacterium]
MKSEFKNLPGSKISLKITLPQEEFKVFVDQALTELAAETELPGYRKGKAPKELVQQKLGEFAIYQKAAEKAIEKLYWQEVEKNNWEAITKPEIAITKLAPNNPLEFEAVFAIVPELNLPDNYKDSLKSLKKEKKPVEVQDKEIQSSLLWLQRSRSSFKEVDRPAEEKDWLTIDLLIKQNNQAVEAGEQNDFRFVLEKDALMPGFFEQVLNQKKGDQLNFSLSAPKDYWQKDLAGKKLDFKVLIKKIEQEILPELNDEFAKTLGKFNSLAELRQSIAHGLKHEAEEKEIQRFRLVLLNHLSEMVELELPEALIDREEEIMLEELKSSIANSGLAWQDYLGQLKKSEADLKKEFKSEAEKRLIYALILAKVAEKESVEPDKQEVEQEADKFLARFKTTGQAEKSIDVYKLIAYTKEKLKNEKTLQLLERIALS